MKYIDETQSKARKMLFDDFLTALKADEKAV